jgi:hypothetical protein
MPEISISTFQVSPKQASNLGLPRISFVIVQADLVSFPTSNLHI